MTNLLYRFSSRFKIFNRFPCWIFPSSLWLLNTPFNIPQICQDTHILISIRSKQNSRAHTLNQHQLHHESISALTASKIEVRQEPAKETPRRGHGRTFCCKSYFAKQETGTAVKRSTGHLWRLWGKKDSCRTPRSCQGGENDGLHCLAVLAGLANNFRLRGNLRLIAMAAMYQRYED